MSGMVRGSALLGLLMSGSACVLAGAQVFTVGERTATAAIDTSFTPTRVSLPDSRMTERGRRELVRMLDAEQGFAHRALPIGPPGLTLVANGNLTVSPSEYRHQLYEKGQSAGAGDRIVVTNLEIKPDRIIVDLNGGPYLKHRFLRHIEINGNALAPNDGEKATGARVVLQFEGGVPELSAPEVKALLDPVLDFGVKTSEQAYADTLPAPLKDAIASHEVLVGMNRRMVLAALGAPESKLREHGGVDGSGIRYEEWIYGHQPQTIRFVRFEGDRVSLIKVAATGKPIELHEKDEMAGYVDPGLRRDVRNGDTVVGDEHSVSPTLLKAGEDVPATTAANPGMKKVEYPVSGRPGAGIPPLPEVPQAAPAKSAPASSAPVSTAPVSTAPVSSAPVSTAPVSTAPAQAAAAQAVPVQSGPAAGAKP